MKFTKKQKEFISATKQKIDELQRKEDHYYLALITELGLQYEVNDKALHDYIFNNKGTVEDVEHKTNRRNENH